MQQNISGHLHTILGVFAPTPRLEQKNISQKILTLDDGDQLSLHVIVGTSNTVVCLFHGLTGSVNSPYMKSTAALAQAQGHSVVMCNHRGCGDGMFLAQHPYHSGSAGDIAAVLKWTREHFAQKKISAIGFSLSANALLLLLSDKKFEHLTKPDAAIAVNAPINLAGCAQMLKMGLNRFYDRHFVSALRKNISARRVQGVIKNNFKIPENCTLYDFDKHYTSPAAGFKNREEYYHQCSTHGKLENITIPTKVLTAANDPFIDVADYQKAKYSSAVEMKILKTGGHIGYLQLKKNHLGSYRSLDQLLQNYVSDFSQNN